MSVSALRFDNPFAGRSAVLTIFVLLSCLTGDVDLADRASWTTTGLPVAMDERTEFRN